MMHSFQVRVSIHSVRVTSVRRTINDSGISSRGLPTRIARVCAMRPKEEGEKSIVLFSSRISSACVENVFFCSILFYLTYHSERD